MSWRVPGTVKTPRAPQQESERGWRLSVVPKPRPEQVPAEGVNQEPWWIWGGLRENIVLMEAFWTGEVPLHEEGRAGAVPREAADKAG